MSTIRTLIAMISSLFGILLIIPIIVLGLPFWAVAFLTHLIHSLVRLFRPKVVPWQQLIEFEPTVGWKPKPNLKAYARADNVFHLTTDSQGWRGQTTLYESEVLVFGDSYAFGYGVDDKSFFAELNPKLRIKAIGINGYNMVQELLWIQRLSVHLRDKLVVWFIYFGNDLYENLQPNLDHYRMPFVRKVNGTGSWEIVTSHISPAKWPSNSQRHYYAKLAEICSPTFLAQRVYSACEFLISRGRDICNQAGAQLVVMSIPDITQISKTHITKLATLAPEPDSFDPDLPDKKIREICSALGVPFVALKNHLKVEDYKEHDVHWNERGHQRVAEVLNRVYHDNVLKRANTE